MSRCLTHSLSLPRPLPKGLLLLITSLQQRNRRKKEGQCETSVRSISVSSDPDTVGIGLCVRVCVCELTDEEQLFMSSCFAYTHTHVFGCLSVCVFGTRVKDVWGDDPIILVLLLTAGHVPTTEINTTTQGRTLFTHLKVMRIYESTWRLQEAHCPRQLLSEHL